MQHSLRAPFIAVGLFVGSLILFTPQASSAAQITITMTDNQFSPKTVSIAPGDTVTWVNNGSMAHTVTADNGTFDSGTIQPGQSFSAIFNSVGTYAYYCKLHGGKGGAGMSGVLTVGAGASGTTIVNTNTNVNTNTYASTNAATVAQLQAQLQLLLNQIAALQGQASPTVPTTGNTTYDSSSCPLIGRSLTIGSSGEDVTRLQQFLARDTAVYPEGQVSGYYGPLTEAAVKRWQVKYHIVSSGTAGTTGYGVVGPRTAAAISILCTTGSYAGVAGPVGSTSTVGGYITVTPISGPAPLTVNVTATINTTHSCTPTTYTLDFGDNSGLQPITQTGGNCGESSMTFTHVYPIGGTYLVKLSAGAHQTTATVVVSGGTTAVVCPAGYSPQVVNGTTVCVQNQGTPTNTNYSYGQPVVSSAPSEPLNFTLQFDLPSSCTGYDVSWGDGTQHSTQSDGGSSCTQSQSTKSLSHTYSAQGAYTIVLKRGATLSRQDDISITIQL